MYRHRQFGFWLVVFTAFIWIVIAWKYFVAAGRLGSGAFIVSSCILALIVIVFSSMTVRVAADTVEWNLAFGAFPQRIRVAEIASTRPVRLSWFAGLGIRTNNFRDWAWVISGRSAVVITMKNGRFVALGTDDATGLLAAIDAARAV